MKKIFLINVLLLLFSAVCLAQDKTRVIVFPEKKTDLKMLKGEDGRGVPTEISGVELVEIRIKDQIVALDQPFEYEDDWLKYLTIKLKNTSDKPITSVRLNIGQPQAKIKDSSLGFSLEFGSLSAFESSKKDLRVIKPGEEFELSRSAQDYTGGLNFQIQKTGVSNINKIVVGSTMIEFEDGNIMTVWTLPLAK